MLNEFELYYVRFCEVMFVYNNGLTWNHTVRDEVLERDNEEMLDELMRLCYRY